MGSVKRMKKRTRKALIIVWHSLFTSTKADEKSALKLIVASNLIQLVQLDRKNKHVKSSNSC